MLGLFKKLFQNNGENSTAALSRGAVIIDVRTPGEYREGHIDQSRNIPLDKIAASVNELKGLKKPVITVCRSGARSGIARNILSREGIEAYNGGPWTSLKERLQ